MPEQSTEHMESVVGELLHTQVDEVKEPSTGTFSTSFIIKAADGRKFLAQLAPEPDVPMLFFERSMMLQSPHIHRYVTEHTDIPIADIAYFDAEGEHFGRPFIIYTMLPGEPMSSATIDDPSTLHRQLGVYLRQLHDRVIRKRFGYIGPHHPMEPQKNWFGALSVMWQKFMDDLVAIGAYTPEEADRYQDLLEDHQRDFPTLPASSLLHMDIWEQNILTDGRQITGIIDWDRCLWGDPEMELVVVEKSSLQTEAFWEGYGRRPQRDPSFFVRRAFYVLYEHQKHIFGYCVRKVDPQAAREHIATCRSLLGRMATGDFNIDFVDSKPA